MTRRELKSLITEMVREEIEVQSNKETIEESCLLLEMNAKKIDMLDFKDGIEGMKYITNYFIRIVETLDSILDKITSEGLMCKTDEDMEKLLNKIIKVHNDTFLKSLKDFNDSKAKGGTRVVYNKLRRVCGKFNMKYSDEAMEEKKKVRDELFGCRDKLINIGQQWCWVRINEKDESKKVPKLKKLNTMLDKLEDIDDKYFIRIYNEIKVIYDRLCQELNATLNDIFGTISLLQLDKEKKLTYKIINALFKTKKPQNESVQLYNGEYIIYSEYLR